MIFRKIVIAVAVSLFSTGLFAQQYSLGPRYTGEEILDELFIGEDTIIVKVGGGGGCTSKGSYQVDAKKIEGISAKTPHYILTINRVHIDECKAIVADGLIIAWDLENDLGLKGNYTFSVKNMVQSGAHPFETNNEENSMLPVIKKNMKIEGIKSEEKSPKNN